MVRIRSQKIGEQLGSLGEFIAGQRRMAQLSLRQLAEQTGISNPYLSQIERGLRKPSAEVLQQLSKALRVSAESLYVRAGILDPDDHRATSVEMAVLADMAITERQKRVLGMVRQMNAEVFGSCTNIGECEAVCPKSIRIENIAIMNRDFIRASWSERGTPLKAEAAG